MRCAVILVAVVLLVCCLNACSFSSKPLPKHEAKRAAEGVTIDGITVSYWSAEEIRQLVAQIACAKQKEPVNAGFRSDSVDMVPEIKGLAIDIEATMTRILSAPAKSAVVSIEVRTNPLITRAKLQSAILIGSAQTPLLDQGKARVHNIRTAAHILTNSIITPGATFSFNDTIGNPTEERGYRLAPIIENGQSALGEGGGVCQISSTLYNAAFAAGLPIVERHLHSKPVDYIKAGMDATTSDDKDFKFRNDRIGLLVLHILVTADTVKSDIWEIRE